jgi:hypothetical protein
MGRRNDEEEDKPVDPELLPPPPAFPTIEMDEAAVEATEFGYSIQGPDDWVIGGPLGEGMEEVRGRWFETWPEAEAWAREKYGPRLKGRKPEEPGSGRRWAFIIRGPRGAV